MIVDTGAGRTVIDDKWADKLGLSESGSITASGTGGDVKARNLRGFTVQLGSESIMVPSMAIPISAISVALGSRIDGILGYEFFLGRVIEIDYAAKKLRAFASKTYKPEPEFYPVPISVEGGRPLVTVDIELIGGKAAQGTFLFDTGANDSVSLSEAFANTHMLELRAGRMTGGVGGMRTSKQTQIRGIRLGNAKFDLKTVSVDPSNRIGRNGLVGSGLLLGRRVVIDYDHHRIHLSQNPFLDR